MLFPDERLAPTAALLSASIALDAALVEHAVRPAGLDGGAADLLVRLASAPNQSLRGVDIGRQLMINPARVSRLIDRAEADGLVIRRPDPEDRRAQRVELTREGVHKAEEYAPLMLELIDDVVFGTFSLDEVRTLTGLLIRLRDAAAQRLEGAAIVRGRS